ncbi:MAG: LamG-like jellyroll fold domain-containing protein [Planctomycetota bacterium]
MKTGRRGSVYLLVLFVATLGAALALGGLWHARREMAVGQRHAESSRVRDISRSGLEVALESVRASEEWRATPGAGAWVTGLSIDGISVNVVAFDATDGVFTDAACEDVTLISYASDGDYLQTYQVAFRPDTASDPASTLIRALYPVGYWPMRDLAGEPLRDWAGLQDAATVGRVRFDGGECDACWGAPVVGGGHLMIEHHRVYELDRGTAMIWFKTDDHSTPEVVLSKGSTTGVHAHGFMLGFNSSLTFAQIASDQGGVTLRGPRIEPDTWVHAAFSWGPAGTKLYVNGELADEDDSEAVGFGLMGTGGLENDHDWLVGALALASDPDTADSQYDLDGRVRDFAVFAGELDAETIQAIHDEGVAPAPLVPAVGEWRRGVID